MSSFQSARLLNHYKFTSSSKSSDNQIFMNLKGRNIYIFLKKSDEYYSMGRYFNGAIAILVKWEDGEFNSG